MNLVVPVPTFERRLVVPVPSLSGRQLLFMAGAATLGIADVLSAPVAAVVASAPLLQKGVRRLAGMSDGAGGTAPRRSTGRRTASAADRGRSTSTSSGRSTTRGRGTSTGRSRRSTRSPRRTTTSTAPTVTST
jgi:hypothetical protein